MRKNALSMFIGGISSSLSFLGGDAAVIDSVGESVGVRSASNGGRKKPATKGKKQKSLKVRSNHRKAAA